MKRRQFNAYLSSLVLGSVVPSTVWAGTDSLEPKALSASRVNRYASACVDKNQQHWLVVFDHAGIEQARHKLVSRAHQVLSHPTKPWVLVVARRPGQYLLAVDLETGQQVASLSPQAGRDFCGHLQISLDGRYLYTTENLTHSSEGLIGKYDIADNFKLVDTFESGGLGPHQLMLNSSGEQLIIANGGIHTRDRVKLNLEDMHSNLSYLSLKSGRIIDRVALVDEYSQVSIRHIDVNQRDQVVIAMQHQGALSDQVPLVALHQRSPEQASQPLQLLDIPQAEFYQLKQYCGSACFDKSGDIIAISAPKGDRILYWDLAKNRYLDSTKVRDGCGLAKSPLAGRFIVSSGRGRVYQINPVTGAKQLLLKDTNLQWDNHLANIG